ncbi:hypothetical protein BamMEX5DRAFT_3308 [Burkholderia ambifaria MEX-5]|uniref:Uncharacterized protein n=1 Tax=Burkholderia ambifaria MEX-5 TaxID=396597 RepID=B1T692_9BURK|nr:hypothetical protein BamMEX5DRAFT_3308 [Burkholderia ambifaria MEX-5]
MTVAREAAGRVVELRGGYLDEIDQLRLDILLHGYHQLRTGFARVRFPQRGEHVAVMVQAET